MNIYESDDYRQILTKAMSRRRKLSKKDSFAKLAAACHIQSPYLSKALNGHTNLNQEQLFFASNYLGFNEEEESYLQLLLAHERSCRSRFKKTLRQKINKIRQIKLRPKESIAYKSSENSLQELTLYYLDPLVQKIHMFLGIEDFGKNPNKICQKLAIKPERLEKVIYYLKSKGLVKENAEGDYAISKVRLHLDSDSDLCLPHQTNLRLQSLTRMQNLSANESFRYSVTFTGDHEAEMTIKQLFLEFLQKSENVIKQAPPRDVFQINFDLFPWT